MFSHFFSISIFSQTPATLLLSITSHSIFLKFWCILVCLSSCWNSTHHWVLVDISLQSLKLETWSWILWSHPRTTWGSSAQLQQAVLQSAVYNSHFSFSIDVYKFLLWRTIESTVNIVHKVPSRLLGTRQKGYLLIELLLFFYFNKNVYLFVCIMSVSACGSSLQYMHSLAVVHGLWSLQAQKLHHVGLVFPVPWGILVP